MILLTWRPASSGWPCTKSCLTNSPRLFSGNSTEPSYQRGSPKLRLVKWPKQRHNLPASLKRHNLDIICETEHLVYNLIVGGAPLSDLEVLRGDPGTQEVLETETSLAPPTAGEFLRKVAIGDVCDLPRVQLRLQERVRPHQ